MSPSPTLATREIGNYELISKIAEGGMGAVYRGRHRNGGPIVAIKIIPAETARNPVLAKRFEQEFRAASLIDHPNVVKAIEYCGTTESPFLVMEFVDGLTLGDRVEREGAIPEGLALHIMSQVCDGLHSAHKQGLIHRDVKPDNVLVTREGIAKLTDLGLVKDIEAEMNLTRTGKGLGTPHFMAPEQFRNAKNADVRCDVYSLGATLYMMITGQIPFAKTSPLDCWLKKTKDDFPPPKALKPILSDRVDFAIRRAMKANPAERPANCREFMEDLTGQAWKPGQPFTPPQETASAPAPASDANALWYMVYYDAGIPRTVKGSTETIRKNVHAGSLGDISVVLVSRTKSGPFSPLRNVPEFRDLILSDGSPPSSGLFQNMPASPPPDLEGLRDNTPASYPTLPSGVRPTSSTNRTPILGEPKETARVEVVAMQRGNKETQKAPFQANTPVNFQLPKPIPEKPEPAPKQNGMPAWFPWVAIIIGAIGFAIGLVSLLKL